MTLFAKPSSPAATGTGQKPLVVIIYLLASFQRRLLVAMQWLWQYATYDLGARLIEEPQWQAGGTRAPDEG